MHPVHSRNLASPTAWTDTRIPGRHTCSGWEIDSYFDEVNDYIDKLNDYVREANELARSAARFAEEAYEYARCEAEEVKRQHE